MENNKLKIRKVHVLSLLNILSEIFDRGVDFIDVYGVNEEGQDTIGIAFSKGYMDEEFMENFEGFAEEQFPSKVAIKLSDEDLNQLL